MYQHKMFWRGTNCSQNFELTQKIWTSPKHFGTCKRTRHKCSQIFGLALNIWTGTKYFGTCKRTRHFSHFSMTTSIWILLIFIPRYKYLFLPMTFNCLQFFWSVQSWLQSEMFLSIPMNLVKKLQQPVWKCTGTIQGRRIASV